jgi:TrmH family RNA methyltransferase
MILSRQNKKLKDIRRWKRSKGDRAVLEGPHLVAEALAAGLPLESVLVTPELAGSPAGAALLASLAEQQPRIVPLEVAAGLLTEIADADSPQGILATALLPRGGAGSLPVAGGGLYLYVDRLQDPGNLGALARAAEAAGAAGLALAPQTVHPNHPRALRASAGSLLRLPAAVDVEPADLDRRLAAAAPLWLALMPQGGIDLYDLAAEDVRRTCVLALGAEGSGLSSPLRQRAGRGLTLPMAPPVESLNATVAAALVLFEIRRRRRE